MNSLVDSEVADKVLPNRGSTATKVFTRLCAESLYETDSDERCHSESHVLVAGSTG